MEESTPSPSQEVQPVQTEDDVLIYTRGIRKKIVDELTKGKSVPSDPADRNLLVSLLNGLDQQAIGIKRIKVDENQNAEAALAMAVAAQVMTAMARNRKNGQANSPAITAPRETPVLGPEVPVPDFVPGEKEISPPALNYETFAAMHNLNSDPESRDDDNT